MSLTHLKTTVNELYAANQEKGNNATKRAHLEAAKTAIAAAIADSGNGTTLTADALVAARTTQTQIVFAENMEDNTMNGSIGLAMNEKRGVEYKHVEDALAAAMVALAAGCTPAI